MMPVVDAVVHDVVVRHQDGCRVHNQDHGTVDCGAFSLQFVVSQVARSPAHTISSHITRLDDTIAYQSMFDAHLTNIHFEMSSLGSRHCKHRPHPANHHPPHSLVITTFRLSLMLGLQPVRRSTATVRNSPSASLLGTWMAHCRQQSLSLTF